MIPFIDLKTQQERIRSKVEERIKVVLDHGQYILGPEVKELEKQLSVFSNSQYVLCCSSGTDALLLALLGLKLKPGEGVIVPAFTFASSAEVMPLLGAIPIFIDVNPNTYNIDHEKLDDALNTATRSGIKVKGIMPVGLFGQPSDMHKINYFAKIHGLWVLDDAAQSFGAQFDDNPVGSLCDVTATSFFPSKPLGCYGDGGAVFTNNDQDAELINYIRLHGKGSEKYDNVRIGMNSRLDTLQAAILIEKLKIFPSELKLRQSVADNYTKSLANLEGLQTPIISSNATSSWAQYTLIVDSRSSFQEKLKESGTPTVIYYPNPLSLQTGYKHYPSVSTGVKVSEHLSQKVVSLPMHPYLNPNEQELIANTIKGLL